MMRMPRKIVVPAGLLVAALACSRRPEPAAGGATITDALETYLARRGDLCVARSTWPVDMTEQDRAQRTRDALQLPVLERLGVVESSPATVSLAGDYGPVAVHVRRYKLTERGRAFYNDRRADLCVARLSLDKVARVQVLPSEQHPERAVVGYTYKVDAPTWMRDPEALRVFPAVARTLAGASRAELEETMVMTRSGWVARELLPSSAAVAEGRP